MLAISRPTTQQRALSLLLVALLHAVLLFAILHFMVVMPKARRMSAPEHLLEMIINTAKKPVIIIPAQRAPPVPSRRMPGGVFSGKLPFTVPPVAPPDVTGLGQALFGCAPENLTNLTPEQRAHCTDSLPHFDDHALLEPKSHVQDPARREAEMRAKKRPGRVPCTSLTEVQTSPGGSSMVPMVDATCALGGLINGFDPLNGLDK